MKPMLRSLMMYEDTNVIAAGNSHKLILVQPILNFIVPFIPTQLSFSVHTAITHFSPGDHDKAGLIFMSPSGVEIYREEFPLKNENSELNSYKLPPSALLSLNIKNMAVYEEGTYHYFITFNGEKIGDQFFDVIRQEL